MAALISALEVARKRLFLNGLLHECVRPLCIALLLLVLLAAAVSPTTQWLPFFGALVITASAAFALFRALRRASSTYETAVQLDRAADLKDRVSTAFYFSHIEHPEGLLRRQREDALARLASVNVPALFPLTAPQGARRVTVLMLVVVALFAYRARYGAPVPAILQRAADTQLVRAMIAPIAHAMEQSREIAKAQGAAEPGEGETRAGAESDRSREGEPGGAEADGEPRPGRQPGQAGDEAAAQNQDKTAEQDRESGTRSDNSGSQSGSDGQDGRQGREQSEDGAEQEGGNEGESGDPRGQKDGDRNQSGRNQSSNDQQGRPENSQRNQSLARSVMQALKSLMSKITGEQQGQQRSNSGENSSDAARNQSQGNQNAGNTPGNPSQSPQSGKSGEKGNDSSSQSASGSQGDGRQKAGAGVGEHAGSDQAGAENTQLGGAHSPDRVGLETHRFSGEAQVRARPGDGVARVASRNAAAPTGARANGAEQENVPPRYRHYVQRYFDHAASGKPAGAPK